MVIKYLGSVAGGRRKEGVLKVLKGAKGAIKEWVSSRGRASRNCVGSLEEQIHNLELIQVQGHGDSNSARQIAILCGSPPKVEVFTWLVIHQRIPVRVELAARGMSLLDNILCPLCGLVPESVAHLLFNCVVSWKIWTRCAAFWGLSIVFPGDPRARNDIIFSNGRCDFVQLMFLVRFRVASWYKAKFSDFTGSVDALIVDPLIADRAGFSNGRVLKARVWEAPPNGYLKLNINGAMAGDGSKGGIGGII
ncbi:hypothetical protein V6N12_000685 [Hibiscus sabdariffa]|uniref:Reverse transcriptase zinc-binding domain-containing protein n=1 Tax=Hibiscus sabdariffa TaxID=183260 RepID=A0ABR2APU4_9ROSI